MLMGCADLLVAAGSCWRDDRIFKEPFREGSPKFPHMNCHVACPACHRRKEWSRKAQVHCSQYGGSTTFRSVSLTGDIESKRRSFSKQLSYGKGARPYIRLWRFQTGMAPLPWLAPPELTWKPWLEADGFIFFLKPTFTLSLISHAHRAAGPAAGLPLPWLGPPLPRGLPRLPAGLAGRAGQRRAGQDGPGWAGPGWAGPGGPGKALPFAPCERAGLPQFRQVLAPLPRRRVWCDTVLTCCNWFPHPPRLRATGSTCDERRAAVTRRRRRARSSPVLPSRRSRGATPRGHRRSKWVSIQCPPGRNGTGRAGAGAGQPPPRQHPAGHRGALGTGVRGSRSGGAPGPGPGAGGGSRSSLAALPPGAALCGPGAPLVRPLRLLCLES